VAKSSKSAKTERQRLIDETLKKQRSAERRRGNMIVGVSVVIALGLIGFAAYPRVESSVLQAQYKDKPLREIGAAASVCKPIEEKPATGVSNHVDEGVKVDYETSPPAYGPHWNAVGAPAPFEQKFYDEDDRPELEQLVHNLEHGYTILWYDDTMSRDQVAQIRSIANKFDSSTQKDPDFRQKFIAAPWTDKDGDPFPEGHVAFTHWKAGKGSDDSIGVFQYCTDVSGDALFDFMLAYPYTDAPEAAVI